MYYCIIISCFRCGSGSLDGISSTVNSIFGERAFPVSAFQFEPSMPVMVSRSKAGFTLNVIDTPGLVEGGYVNGRTVQIIKRFMLNKTVDILLYVDRLDTYRVDNLEKQVVQAITDSFGKEIWKRALLVLTHAQLLPPDGMEYDVFSSKRSEGLLKVVRSGARASGIPVALVENGRSCNKNENDEKVLPSGIARISNVVKNIVDVALNGSKGILADEKLVEGPNPNRRWKELIPFYFCIPMNNDFFGGDMVVDRIFGEPLVQIFRCLGEALRALLLRDVRTPFVLVSALGLLKYDHIRVSSEY